MIVGSSQSPKRRPPSPAWWDCRNTGGPLVFAIVIIGPSIAVGVYTVQHCAVIIHGPLHTMTERLRAYATLPHWPPEPPAPPRAALTTSEEITR